MRQKWEEKKILNARLFLRPKFIDSLTTVMSVTYAINSFLAAWDVALTMKVVTQRKRKIHMNFQPVDYKKHGKNKVPHVSLNLCSAK